FLWRDAEQFAVEDEVIRVLVVPVVVDVVADVVQQRRVAEDAPVRQLELEPVRERVEELERQRLHRGGVLLLEVTALREIAYRALPRLAGVRDGGGDARRFE